VPRALGFVLFFLVAVGVVGGVHAYIWLRLIRDGGLPPPWRSRATVLLIVLALSLPTAMFVRRLFPFSHVVSILMWPAFFWMGLMLLLFFCFLGVDLIRLAFGGVSRIAGLAPSDPSRRAFLARATGLAAGAVATGMGCLSLYFGTRFPSVREVRVRLRRLPAALSGLTIVQLTDLHIGLTLGRRFVEEVVARVNQLRPDVIVITGDLVDGSVAGIGGDIAPIADLRARHGVFFVTGNHEYYSGVTEWLAHLPSLGVRVLRNQRVTIGEGADLLDLAGVDDWNARHQAQGHGPDLAAALAGRDPNRTVVLLAHQPRQLHEAARAGVDLQLSGHTHGGQIWPWNYMVRLQQPVVAGLAREGETQIYVSSGTGYWGPPMRLGAPAEITRVVLEREV
jgi:uncharacterized protein